MRRELSILRSVHHLFDFQNIAFNDVENQVWRPGYDEPSRRTGAVYGRRKRHLYLSRHALMDTRPDSLGAARALLLDVFLNAVQVGESRQ